VARCGTKIFSGETSNLNVLDLHSYEERNIFLQSSETEWVQLGR
jgi:hypothetical protein